MVLILLKNLHKLSSKNHTVICDYFNVDKFDRQFDVITAQNVFAHNSNPKSFYNIVVS